VPAIDDQDDQPDNVISISRFIEQEVKKLLNSNIRLSQQSFDQLEQRVVMEIYLREKKHAILKDR
jgi:hypothetical protein